MREDVLKYYTTFVEHSGCCSTLVKASLDELYYWLIQSIGESKNSTCTFRNFINGYELSCLNDLVKASVEVDGGGVKIIFIRGFVFVPEHASGSDMNLFNVVYELGDKGEKLYFDNPLGDPCETSEGEAINTFLDTLAKIFKLCEERS
jgi:hypothetical protein